MKGMVSLLLIRAELSLLLVEQNAMLTFEATSHCLVLENGEIALTGTSAELRGNPRIRRLYLGLRGWLPRCSYHQRCPFPTHGGRWPDVR
jgi:ABC-type lipopolysaccharide export system ATPase subunit